MAISREGISTISGKIREAAGCCQLTELRETVQGCWALQDGQSLTQVRRHESHLQCPGQGTVEEKKETESERSQCTGGLSTQEALTTLSSTSLKELVKGLCPLLLPLLRQGQRRRREADVGPGQVRLTHQPGVRASVSGDRHTGLVQVCVEREEGKSSGRKHPN